MARVLVVEDEDVTRQLIEARLVKAGHWVRTAGSAAEAHTVLRRIGPPEVLVSDMFMPGGNGLSLASSMREEPGCAHLPVIFLSGRALPGDVAAGQALGATYLSKPVSVPALTSAIDAAVESNPPALAEAVRRRLSDLGDTEADDRQLLVELLTTFVEQAPAARQRVEDALQSGDAEGLEAAAHRLMSAATTLGAGPLAALCADLQDRARTGELPAPAVVTASLERELAVTCRVFQALAAEFADDEETSS